MGISSQDCQKVWCVEISLIEVNCIYVAGARGVRLPIAFQGLNTQSTGGFPHMSIPPIRPFLESAVF